MVRYELSASQWGMIEGFLPGRPGAVGVTAKDNRNFVNGVLWVLRSGAHWKHLPTDGNTYRPSMESGRVSTSVSLAGPRLVYGSESSRCYWRIPTTPTS